MRHTVLDNDYIGTNGRNELQAMFAMATIVRPVSKQPVSRQPVSKRLANWWRKSKHERTTNRMNPQFMNPQGAASPLMSHRPAGRRAPPVQSQQTLFAVLDQMGARHSAARRQNLFG